MIFKRIQRGIREIQKGPPMANSEYVSAATDTNFESEVIKSPHLVLIDFWAEWCGPCRLLAPTVEEIAREYQGKLKVYKMNVDENPNTPARFHIRGIPTILFFKDGNAIDQLVGNHPKATIAQVIEKHL